MTMNNKQRNYYFNIIIFDNLSPSLFTLFNLHINIDNPLEIFLNLFKSYYILKFFRNLFQDISKAK